MNVEASKFISSFLKYYRFFDKNIIFKRKSDIFIYFYYEKYESRLET